MTPTTTPTPKRPVGLILALIALGCLAALQLLLTAGTGLMTFLVPHSMPPSQVSPGVMMGLFATLTLFFALTAAWSISTLIGLARLRSWARISVLILGGCLAAVGAISVLSTLATRAMLPTITAQQPAANPQVASMVSATILVITLFYALLTAIGAWWLIYFNLRPTRALFSQTPLLDTVTGLPLPAPPPGRYAHVPTPIFLLACLYGLSVVFGPIFALLPFPAFFFGFIINRPAAPILYLAIAILSGLIGYGLLRLDPRARIAAFVMMAIGAINMGLSLLPWYQQRMHAYLQQFLDTVHLTQPTVQPTINPYFAAMVGVIAGIAFTAYFVWALIKYRYAFAPGYPAPPPPQV